jgi:cation diffusion facilitator family transporter
MKNMIEVRHNNTNDKQKNIIFKRAIWITFVGNFALAISKVVIATLANSSALFAEAANSISDVFYTILLIIGLSVASQPPDESHPQGHSRFEPLVGLVVTIAMTLAAYEAGRNAISKIITGPESIPLAISLIMISATAIVKTVMFLLVRGLAKEYQSPSLKAISIDNLTDISSAGVAFVGILLSNYLHPVFDPIAGFIIAGWILFNALKTSRENILLLTGGAAPDEVRNEIIRRTTQVPGVIHLHHLITEYAGPHLIVDMHVNISGAIPFQEAHKISDNIIESIEKMEEVDRVYVHLEPENFD